MKRLYVVALLGGAAAILGTAALAAGVAKSRTTAPAAPVEISIPQRHSMADLDELPTGITYDDAARRLGTPGHSENRRAAGLPWIAEDSAASVFAWPNPDGSRIVLVFRDGLLTHKTHEGLR